MTVSLTSSGVDSVLEQARGQIDRVHPYQARLLVDAGGLLIDIRPAADRARFGHIPGAIVIERNVLEWRLDPSGPHRIAELRDANQFVVIFCNEGFASSLAAASARQIGLHNVSDLIGGYSAWERAGFPTTAAEPVQGDGVLGSVRPDATPTLHTVRRLFRRSSS